ncbi:uncharacterized protein LOC118435456 isoform X2 [Folsomia candida]|uniref:uncharacterized protein LOC118435456 isoform X2 n=1 Tax=Folsomia candida TaxID=158441 RepID=UPI00160526E9|nr:uncharacterized protein LOC118435456 isoform X2 [Folsomia candida]
MKSKTTIALIGVICYVILSVQGAPVHSRSKRFVPNWLPTDPRWSALQAGELSDDYISGEIGDYGMLEMEDYGHADDYDSDSDEYEYDFAPEDFDYQEYDEYE